MPAINPVAELEGEEGLTKVIIEGPDTKPQLPAPDAGLFPASVVVVTLHNAWSGPALAIVGNGYTSTVVESAAPQTVGASVVITYRIVAVAELVFVRIFVMVLEEVPVKLTVAPVAVPETVDDVQ